jgi:hypothetical protein
MGDISGELDTGAPFPRDLGTYGPLEIEPYEPLTCELGNTLEVEWEPLDIGTYGPLEIEPYEPLEIDWTWLDRGLDFTEARKAYTVPDHPPSGGPGRKGPRLSDPRVQRFLEALEAGLFIDGAAAWAGIGERTARRWLSRGRTDEATDTPSSYLQLWQAAQVAQAIATTRALEVINTAIRGGDWKAAAWLLEHRWTERWGNPNPPRPGPAQRARIARVQAGK